MGSTYFGLRRKGTVEYNPLYYVLGEYPLYVVTTLAILIVIYLWYLGREYWFVNVVAVICIIIKLYVVIHNLCELRK